MAKSISINDEFLFKNLNLNLRDRIIKEIENSKKANLAAGN